MNATLILSQNSSNIESNSSKVLAGRYTVKIAETSAEINSALRLRFEVFNVELAGEKVNETNSRLEFDQFDERCHHLIAIENSTGKTVGTYRLNLIEKVEEITQLYSFKEFRIEDLPVQILTDSVEIGRACIAREHRNTKVLFLIWKGLADFLKRNQKRYLFGCCSIFTTNAEIGNKVFQQLKNNGLLHKIFWVEPRQKEMCDSQNIAEEDTQIELPNLFKMYMKIGAKICSEPAIDHKFGTIDYFVIFDLQTLNHKYHRMFFDSIKSELYRCETEN